MAFLLFHRKTDDKYRLYSELSGDYITKWSSKERTQKVWEEFEMEMAKRRVANYMKLVDREVE